jgi:hypothetical protein
VQEVPVAVEGGRRGSNVSTRIHGYNSKK